MTRSATSCASGSTSYARQNKLRRGAAPRAADHVRPRDARADGLLQRASRTTRATCRGAKPGEPPPTLLDYFPKDFLLFVDESHQTVPQIGAMYRGRPRAQGDAGRVRLPAARARSTTARCKFDEWEAHVRAGDLRLGDARRVRAAAGARRGGRADHPPDRAARPRDRGPPGRWPGRRSARRDPRARARPASACWSPR